MTKHDKKTNDNDEIENILLKHIFTSMLLAQRVCGGHPLDLPMISMFVICKSKNMILALSAF